MSTAERTNLSEQRRGGGGGGGKSLAYTAEQKTWDPTEKKGGILNSRYKINTLGGGEELNMTEQVVTAPKFQLTTACIKRLIFAHCKPYLVIQGGIRSGERGDVHGSKRAAGRRSGRRGGRGPAAPHPGRSSRPGICRSKQTYSTWNPDWKGRWSRSGQD